MSTNDVFYLELSQPFNTMSPPWINLSDVSPLPVRLSWATSSYGGANNRMIFIFGGTMQAVEPAQDLGSNALLPDFKNLVYSFDTQSFQWSIPIISGDAPNRRRELSAVTNDRGKIHFFGGKADRFTGSSIEGDFNEMNVLDSLTLNWELGTLDGAPTPRDGHTATILNNGLIVFIGGREMAGPDNNLSLVNMRSIDVYDTKSAEWYFIQAAGPLVEGRILHSAVLMQDNRIIVYGGVNSENGTSSSPVLVVLDTRPQPYLWSIPKISATIFPPPLITHTAALVGDYMLVAFGNITNTITKERAINNEMFLLDIRTFTWVNRFEPSTIGNYSIPIGIIIGASIGGALFLVALGFGIKLICKWQRIRRNRVHRSSLPIPVSGNRYHIR
ncbi:9885_t:CDS:2 [Funneliformis caledonium]|uniref:9885_t:CDS:1 n=1 Tax=Funneliformis caledonium TaxID=1117310 RepID=A0A9N9GGL1_9GLOM|nr:9885_t:CDS:2 [Funneliformis caledonium]